MQAVYRILAKLRAERGFSLAEVLVAGLVLVVGLFALSHSFASSAARVMESDIRSVLHQVATEEIEEIRALPYNAVGTVNGHPHGNLFDEEDITVQNMTVHIQREIVYWTDPSYEDDGPYPANYKRVTVTVSAVGRPGIKPVELVTNVAGGAKGGTLDITVTNIRGEPVQGALLTITNDHLVPPVNIHSSAMKTDSSGHLFVPGLTPDDTPSYMVTASKSGYNSDHTDPAVVVKDGFPYTVVHLIIDRLSNMVVKVEDTAGNPVEGLNLTVLGPAGFQQSIVSTAEGVAFSDIRYSTDLDPYVVILEPTQNYQRQEMKVILDPGTTQEVVAVVPTLGSTTTTLAPSPTTTLSPPTTLPSGPTTTVKHSLRVTVLDKNGNALKGATVALDDGNYQTTNGKGRVFFDNLEARMYGLTIAHKNYWDAGGSVNVYGATTITFSLQPK